MKHIKTFEAKKTKDSTKDDIELLRDLLMENPLYETHDFFIFLAGETFEETEGGLYKKVIDIENMVKITPDENSLAAMQGLTMRSRFQHNTRLYHIWLPKEISEEVEGKGSRSIEPWLLELIDKHKVRGADEHGKQVYRDVVQRKKDMDKYNL